jgi:2-dehydropantoate 2-reductase
VAEVAVVGPGGVGGYFAAQLAASGRDVVACSRRPFAEWVVESKRHPVQAPARVATDPADLDGDGRARWVLFAVKAHQSEGAAPWLARLCDATTTVVVVQNGVEGVERVTPFAHGATVLPSVVYCGATLLAPGRIRHRQNGFLWVPDGDESESLAKLFEGTGGQIRPTATYLTEAWRKLGLNVMANGPTALARRGSAMFAEPAMAELARALLEECFAVGRACGAELTSDDVDAIVRGLGGRDGPSSMLTDRLAGRPTEHDAIYGAVVRAGVRHGIATPLAQAIGALVAAGDGPSWQEPGPSD